jgi:hypothetical protein
MGAAAAVAIVALIHTANAAGAAGGRVTSIAPPGILDVPDAGAPAATAEGASPGGFRTPTSLFKVLDAAKLSFY